MRIKSDKRRLLQIFLNFMSNSMKFTSKNGYIKVIVQLVEQHDIHSETVYSKFSKIVKRNTNNSRGADLPSKYVKLNIIFEDNGAGISEDNI